jgi:hypothetical protein
MKQVITLVIASVITMTGFSQLPEKAQIKKLGIKKIVKYTGKTIAEREFDKEGYEIKLTVSGKLVSESKVYYNKYKKPDSIIASHSIFGIVKKVYQYSAIGGYKVITITPAYKSTDTLFFDKNNREIRQAWSNGQMTLNIYNVKNQLTQIIETKPNGDTFTTSFSYDQKGQKISYRRMSGANKIETQVTYTYNATGQLIKDSQTDENGEVFLETNYQYNAEKGLPSATTGKFMGIETRESYEYYFF